MSVSMKDVRAFLDSEEPDYRRAAKLGVGALPHLSKLVGSKDALLASKAAYLAGLIKGPKAAQVVAKAAKSAHAEVRVAAASTAANLKAADSEAVLSDLVKDKDPGVRKLALRSIDGAKLKGLKTVVKTMASKERVPFLKAKAAEIAPRLE